MSGPEPSLAVQARGRELVALVDGPWAPRWFLHTTVRPWRELEHLAGVPYGAPVSGSHHRGRACGTPQRTQAC